jgi:hypothetical protein
MAAAKLEITSALQYDSPSFVVIRGWFGSVVMSIETMKQEAFSKAFVRTLAARIGVSVTQPENDFGTDLILTEIKARKEPDGTFSFVDQSSLKLQVKSTINFAVREGHVVYDLPVKNYNDLVDESSNVPRILVLVHVPSEREQWFTHHPEELVLRYKGVWMSLAGQSPSENTSTQRIQIPASQVFNESALNSLFAKIREEGRL